jgi:recombination protein RecT
MTTDNLPALVESTRAQFVAVRSDKSIDFDREAGFAMQILQGSDYLRSVALNNRESLFAAITNVAAIGVSLNPAEKLAYLVPRKKAVCLDISYMGLLDIAQSAGAIRWGQAVIVREKDAFELQGIDKEPKHVYQPFGERGKIIGVYVVVKTPDGDYLTHPMPLSKVHDIRDRSEAWKAYQKDNTKKCPWNTDEEEMIKKTCVKQAAKYWPKSPRLDAAIHHLNTDGGEGITLHPNMMPEAEYLDWKAQIEKCTTKEAAKAVWKKALNVCEELGDVITAEKLKDVLVKHGEFIAGAAARDKVAA